MLNFFQAVEVLPNRNEYLKLSEIGGHKKFHLEGNALYHSRLVYEAAVRYWPEDKLLHRAALLHDIGKLFSSQCHGENDWTYAGHSAAGAEHLSMFVPESDPDFQALKLLVAEHIKPLFWHTKETPLTDILVQYDGDVDFVLRLAKLGSCDLIGSKPSRDGVAESMKASFYINKIINECTQLLEMQSESQGLYHLWVLSLVQ